MRMRLVYVFVLGILCGGMSLRVFAQPIDSSYLTTYYEQKVSLFRLLPSKKNAIIFLGNSITDIGEWAEIWQHPRVINRGVSSDNTFGVMARLDEVTQHQPAKIFVMIGINDIARGTPVATILSNYSRIISEIKSASPRTQVYIQSVLPTNNSFSQFVRHQNKDSQIREVNEGLAQLALQEGLDYIHLYPHFLDETGKLSSDYTNDGLHLNGAGYMLWKQILTEGKYCCR
jgi:lysophospholipase L1-like esterase